jgi:hypothetical protein
MYFTARWSVYFDVRKIELENEDSARELRAAVERGEYLLDRINYGRSATKFSFSDEWYRYYFKILSVSACNTVRTFPVVYRCGTGSQGHRRIEIFRDFDKELPVPSPFCHVNRVFQYFRLRTSEIFNILTSLTRSCIILFSIKMVKSQIQIHRIRNCFYGSFYSTFLCRPPLLLKAKCH